MQLDLMDFAYSYITRSGRIDDARLARDVARLHARYEASERTGNGRPGMTSFQPLGIVDQVPADSPGAREDRPFAIPGRRGPARDFDRCSPDRAAGIRQSRSRVAPGAVGGT